MCLAWFIYFLIFKCLLWKRFLPWERLFFCPCVVQGGCTAVRSRASSDSLLQNYSCLLIVIENEQMIRVHQMFGSIFEDFQDSEDVRQVTHSPALSRMRMLLSKHCLERQSASPEGGICWREARVILITFLLPVVYRVNYLLVIPERQWVHLLLRENGEMQACADPRLHLSILSAQCTWSLALQSWFST